MYSILAHISREVRPGHTITWTYHHVTAIQNIELRCAENLQQYRWQIVESFDEQHRLIRLKVLIALWKTMMLVEKHVVA